MKRYAYFEHPNLENKPEIFFTGINVFANKTSLLKTHNAVYFNV